MKVFHHNDMDGYSAAHIIKRYKGLNMSDIKRDFVEVTHDIESDKKKFESVNEGEEVWIVDFSFTEPTVENILNLMKKNCKITWIDHHISSVELIKSHPELNRIPGLIKDGISGAALTYLYCFNSKEGRDVTVDECPEYIQLISDYDCWYLKMNPRTDLFKLYYDCAPNKWEFLDQCYDNRFDSGFIAKCCEGGKIVKNFIDNENKYYRETYGYESEYDGMKVFVVPKDSNSWIFGELIQKYPMVVNYGFDGEKYTYSLYADKKFSTDCSKIAEKHGGGGHKGAAGFQSKELIFKKKK